MSAAIVLEKVYKKTLAELLPELLLPSDIAGVSVEHIALDNRKVNRGGLFVALIGSRVDGRNYIGGAIKSGVTAVFVQGEKYSTEIREGVPLITIPNLGKELGFIAARFYDQPSHKLKVIGVTGTNGKSTCVSLLSQAFELLGKKAWQLGTCGYGSLASGLHETGLTTPDAISCQQILAKACEMGVRVVAMEVSSHAIAQHRIAGIKFAGAGFTNISHDHLDYHKNFAEYRQVKQQFVEHQYPGFAVINQDDDLGAELRGDRDSANCFNDSRLLFFSIKSPTALVYVDNFKADLKGIEGKISGPWGNANFRSSLVGEFNLANLMAVICCLCAAGEDFKQVIKQLPNLQAVEGRLQPVESFSEDDSAPRVFVDYAHTPDALEKVLLTIKNLTEGKLLVVFGCGGDRDKSKRKVMGQVAATHADNVVLTSDNPRTENPGSIIENIQSGFGGEQAHETFEDRREAIEFAVNQLEKHDSLLVAGKGHEKYQIVGTEKIPFSDYLVARQALRAKTHNVRGQL